MSAGNGDAEQIDKKAAIDLLLKLYSENMSWARHYEKSRAETTNYIIALSGVIFGLVGASADKVGIPLWLALIFVVMINLYGLLLSLKHWERGHRYTTIAEVIREELSNYSIRQDIDLASLVKKGASLAGKGFAGHFRRIALYKLWCGVHLAMIALAMVSAIVLWRRLLP